MTPDNRSSLERVREIVARELNIAIDRVTPESDVFADLGGDELDRINIVFAIEDEFTGNSIADEEAFTARTVADFVEVAERRPLPKREARR